MEQEKNLQALRAAGIIPPVESHLPPGSALRFSEAEKAAIESLSDLEIQAIINAKDKLGVQFFLKNAASGYY
jgi:hypothetical protein